MPLGQYTAIKVISDELLVTVYFSHLTMKAVLLLSVLASALAAPETRYIDQNCQPFFCGIDVIESKQSVASLLNV